MDADHVGAIAPGQTSGPVFDHYRPELKIISTRFRFDPDSKLISNLPGAHAHQTAASAVLKPHPRIPELRRQRPDPHSRGDNGERQCQHVRDFGTPRTLSQQPPGHRDQHRRGDAPDRPPVPASPSHKPSSSATATMDASHAGSPSTAVAAAPPEAGGIHAGREAMFCRRSTLRVAALGSWPSRTIVCPRHHGLLSSMRSVSVRTQENSLRQVSHRHISVGISNAWDKM